MPTFDEVEQTLLLAVTDPNSPHFSKAMSDLRAAALEKELEVKKVDRICLAMLMDKEMEKNLSLEEQIAHAQKVAAKYMEDYAAYQREIYKQQVEDMKLEPKQLHEYLINQNSELEKEIKKLEDRLANLPAEQAAVKEKWDKMQKNSEAEFANELNGMSFAAAGGTTRKLQEKDINKLTAAVFGRNYDPNKIINSVPGLATADPEAKQQIATKMTGGKAVMDELMMLGGMDNIDGSQASTKSEERSVDRSSVLKPSELRAMREKNQPLVNTGLTQIKKQSDQVKKLHVEAINASEGCVKQQIELAKNRIDANNNTLQKTNKNELEADQDPAKKTSHLPTPKPRGY